MSCRFRAWLSALFVGVTTLTLGAQQASYHELDRLSNEFEAARLSPDEETLRRFVHEDATQFGGLGADTRNLFQTLQGSRARRNRDTDGKDGPISVVNRRIAVHGETAAVTELLGAAVGTESGRKVIPQRRTLVWSKVNGRWQVVHEHTSTYSLWEQAISRYEEADKEQLPDAGGIVFIGSSSIRGWRTLAEDFPGQQVIGRGFGGSQMVDSRLYAHRVVLPYRPRAVAVYAGDNDIAAGKSPAQVLADFQSFVQVIHADRPQTRIGFIAIKPSLRRWNLWPSMHEANALIEAFAKEQESVDFLDIATPMLGADGLPQKHLFVKDGLHLTRAGYRLWTSVVSTWVNQ